LSEKEQIIDENLDEEGLDEETDESEEESVVPSWKDLQFIPNKKRFIILTTVFSVVEFVGMIVLAYAFTDSFVGGLWDLGLFLMPPFTGVAIAYFVAHKKEAIAVSFINAVSSIILFWIIFLSIEAFNHFPKDIGTLQWYDYVIPIVMILIQVAIAFTIARLRNIYNYYGEAKVSRDSDEAMIEELKESRRIRGLEQYEDDEEELEANKEK